MEIADWHAAVRFLNVWSNSTKCFNCILLRTFIVHPHNLQSFAMPIACLNGEGGWCSIPYLFYFEDSYPKITKVVIHDFCNFFNYQSKLIIPIIIYPAALF